MYAVEVGGVSTEAGKPQFVLLCMFVCLRIWWRMYACLCLPGVEFLLCLIDTCVCIVLTFKIRWRDFWWDFSASEKKLIDW